MKIQKRCTAMRDYVIAVGGPLRATENRKAWLARVADQAGLGFWVVHAVWHERQMSRQTKNKLIEAAGRDELNTIGNLVEQLRHVDPTFHGPQIAPLLEEIDRIRAMVGAGDKGK